MLWQKFIPVGRKFFAGKKFLKIFFLVGDNLLCFEKKFLLAKFFCDDRFLISSE